MRLWNIATGVTVLIFAGRGGHRNEVLSCDFHPLAEWQLASCGMDNAIKTWDFSGAPSLPPGSIHTSPPSSRCFIRRDHPPLRHCAPTQTTRTREGPRRQG